MKPIPLAMTLDPGTRRMDRAGAAALTAVEESAVETALRLRDDVGGDVILVTMVPDGAAESLRPALAMGADRAVVVSSDDLIGSDLVSTSTVLAAAARHLAADLVVVGAASGDGNGALLGSALGEQLQVPVLSHAAEVGVVAGRIRGRRQTEAGPDVVEVGLPAVLAISGEICTPRYPSFRDVIAAKRKPIEIMTPESLGLTSTEVGEKGSRTRVRSLSTAAPREDAEILVDAGNAHERIVEFLRERGLV